MVDGACISVYLKRMTRFILDCLNKENLMPLFIECVENDITLGEICNTLRGVWGDTKCVRRDFRREILTTTGNIEVAKWS